MDDAPALILDANIMISALMGRSFPLLVSLAERGVALLAPLPQLEETRERLAAKSSFAQTEIEAQMRRLTSIVFPLQARIYDRHESKARLRLHERGQPDWPLLAASIETQAAIWSHDKDFWGCGAPVWSTFMLRRQLAHAR